MLRHTQRVSERSLLTTSEEKLSKTIGPLYWMDARPLNRLVKSTAPVPRYPL